MDVTKDKITRWFDAYYEAFNKNAGPVSALSTMSVYFAPDLEFWSYVVAGERPVTREALLMTMVHPGLHEHMTPREYAVDLEKMLVAVQFQVQISDKPSGRVWPPKQGSGLYYLIPDEATGFKIKKIMFFMEQRPPEESSYRELWAKYRQQALAGTSLAKDLG
jgi:hypothetical protein